jgi:hypothetical protein
MKQSPKKPKPSQGPGRARSATFWINTEEFARLKQHAAEHGLSTSGVINRAIKCYLARHGRAQGN